MHPWSSSRRFLWFSEATFGFGHEVAWKEIISNQPIFTSQGITDEWFHLCVVSVELASTTIGCAIASLLVTPFTSSF